MSKRKWGLLAGVLVLFIVIELLLPKPLNWLPTYSHKDKNPFGAFVLAELLPGFLSAEPPVIKSVTLYETDSLPGQLNLLVLADEFYPSQEDITVLLRRVAEGDRAFIAAHFWNEPFFDTLGFSFQYDYNLNANIEGAEEDSISLQFNTAGLPHLALPRQNFRYPAGVLAATFDSLPAGAGVLAKTEQEEAVLVSMPWGKGTFYLSSTPLLYTNYFLMQQHTRPFAQAALNFFPAQPLFWTEYYHLGRIESPTPLRFILKEPALRWSYYLGMGVLLGFVLFSLKRRQRAIPVVAPPANTSLQFAHTIARLYYSQGDHHNIAQKKIRYFKEWLREHYQMPAGQFNEEYIKRVLQKSRKPEAEVRGLFQYLEKTQNESALSAEALLKLQHKIDSFTRK